MALSKPMVIETSLLRLSALLFNKAALNASSLRPESLSLKPLSLQIFGAAVTWPSLPRLRLTSRISAG
jgi:hypothetical protein